MTAWQVLRETPRRIQEVAEQARPSLQRVPLPPRRLSRGSFAGVMVAVLVAGMIGLLGLNTTIQQQALQVRAAQRTANELGSRLSDLEAQVSRAQAPAQLAGRASDLGMVPNPHGVFIDLATGQVIGTPTPVSGTEVPSLRVRPTSLPPASQVQQVNSTILPWVDLSAVPAPLPVAAPPVAP